MWNYGKEVWCNLEGRYMHIVADLTHYSGSMDPYLMTLCQLGIMGTKYVRATAVPTTQTMQENSTASLSIDKITSFYDIGNVLDIKLRQSAGSELPWVMIA